MKKVGQLSAVHATISFSVSFLLLCFQFIGISKTGCMGCHKIDREKKETGRPKQRELHELPYTEIDREKEKRQGDQNRENYMNCHTQK